MPSIRMTAEDSTINYTLKFDESGIYLSRNDEEITIHSNEMYDFLESLWNFYAAPEKLND